MEIRWAITWSDSGRRVDVSGGGAVNWHAVPTMFDDHVDIAWTVGLHDAPTAGVSGTLRVNHAARQMPILRTGIMVQQLATRS